MLENGESIEIEKRSVVVRGLGGGVGWQVVARNKGSTGMFRVMKLFCMIL